jgi:predicted DNA-binding mobile mystery protein A
MTRKTQPRLARQKTRQLDDELAATNIPSRPRSGWIAAVRQALGMSQTQLAARMDIVRQSLNNLESNELKGTISLASLRNAADGLDCDLQYVLVPRKPLQQLVADQALQRATKKLGRINQSQALEASAIEAESLSRAVADLATEIEILRPVDLWND